MDTIKIAAPTHRNAVVLAMMNRKQSGGAHKNRRDKRAAQKARRAERNAY